MGSKYPWLRHPAKFNSKQWREFQQLRESDLKTARMMNERLENIRTYLKHGITNAISEALNSKIQWVK